jgi:hypothetical protein
LRSLSWWALAGVAACSGTDPSTSYVAHDPCAALMVRSGAATTAQQDGITDALALWRGLGVSAFDQAAAGAPIDPPPAAAVIEIRFDDAGATFHGVYDPESESVLINRDLLDRTELAIVIAHELGHVFGLVHVAPATRVSLMNPGNLTTAPTEADQRALQALWGECAPSSDGDRDVRRSPR